WTNVKSKWSEARVRVYRYTKWCNPVEKLESGPDACCAKARDRYTRFLVQSTMNECKRLQYNVVRGTRANTFPYPWKKEASEQDRELLRPLSIRCITQIRVNGLLFSVYLRLEFEGDKDQRPHTSSIIPTIDHNELTILMQEICTSLLLQISNIHVQKV
ncbi:uncharacterized protein LOC100872926, partial [Apis florea]|uniref:uncharacterized protein LOC100872926 n=1 Tax=Apis florea TaxID=7463 RepID=UPI0012FF41C0